MPLERTRSPVAIHRKSNRFAVSIMHRAGARRGSECFRPTVERPWRWKREAIMTRGDLRIETWPPSGLPCAKGRARSRRLREEGLRAAKSH